MNNKSDLQDRFSKLLEVRDKLVAGGDWSDVESDINYLLLELMEESDYQLDYE